MKSFKQHLTEATSTEVSTALETVLGVAYEAASARGDQKKVLITLMNKSAHKSKFSKTNAFWKTNKGTTISDIDADNLLIFGKKVRDAVGGGDGSFSFQNKGNVTADWAKWSGKEIIKYEKDGVTVKSTTTKKDVSKTDIVLGKKKYSVKNADGAQLMSGKKGESIATAEAAALTSGLDPALLSKLTNGFNALEAFTTEGYYASIENLKSLYTNKKKEIKTLLDLATAVKKERDAYDAETDKEVRQKRWNPDTWKGPGELSPKGRPILTKGMNKILKPENQQNILDNEYYTTLTNKNEEFMKNVEREFEAYAENAKYDLSNAFANNASFKNAFVYEAATGDQKFGPIIQRADYMLSWAPKGKIQDFIVKVEPVGTATSPAQVIKNYANAMDLQVNWKSSAQGDHGGYNVYQNVRISVKAALKEAEENQKETNEEYEHLSQQLDEGYLEEGKFWDKIKDLATKFWNKAKEIWNKVVGIFSEVVKHIKDAAEHGVRALSNVLGFDMEVTDSLRNKTLKVRI